MTKYFNFTQRVSLGAITRSVQGKFNGITVNFDMTNPSQDSSIGSISAWYWV